MNNIGILGGDLRIIFLGEMFAKDGYNVYTYGIEKYNIFNKNIIKCKTIDKMCEFCDSIVSAIPFSKDGIYVNAPFSNSEININYVLKIINNKTLIAGVIKPEIKENANKNKINIIDLMDYERLTILNVIPTVEGAIQVAMENTDITIHNSKCLVLGFGRIGKLLSKTLKDLGANVSCVARKDEDLTWIKLYGNKEIHINDLSNNLNDKYDIIFNTIPALVLDNNKLKILKEMNNSVTIIDLASSPGGVDLKKTEEYDIKVIKALGLPGKVAPLTAAKYIKETLKTIIREENK